VSGDIDLDAEQFNLEGVLVPVYGVNSALGAIPVIGDIFVSRQGEGVFGLTYSIQGPFEQATVFVNPLSAFALGFTRRLFEPVPQAAPAAPQTETSPEPTQQVPQAAEQPPGAAEDIEESGD
jgi:hypothetical protein